MQTPADTAELRLSPSHSKGVLDGATIKRCRKNNSTTAKTKVAIEVRLAGLLLAGSLVACAEGGYAVRVDTSMSDDPEYHLRHGHYNLADRMASGFGH